LLGFNILNSIEIVAIDVGSQDLEFGMESKK